MDTKVLELDQVANANEGIAREGSGMKVLKRDIKISYDALSIESPQKNNENYQIKYRPHPSLRPQVIMMSFDDLKVLRTMLGEFIEENKGGEV